MSPLLKIVFRGTVVVSTFLAISAAGQTRDAKEAAPRTKVKLQVQPLNVKPGLWETTSTHRRSGAPPIPPEALARLNPEQRARVEERMKANGASSSGTSTKQSCVTKEDIEKADFGQGRGECTYVIQTSTSTQAKGTYSCNTEGVQANGSIEIDAPDPEHVSGNTQGKFSAGGKTMNIDTTFTSKLVSPNCSKEQ